MFHDALSNLPRRYETRESDKTAALFLDLACTPMLITQILGWEHSAWRTLRCWGQSGLTAITIPVVVHSGLAISQPNAVVALRFALPDHRI